MPISALAQSAENRYHSRMTADGYIFFCNAHKLNQLDNIKKFEYDMTFLTWTDSVTVNFTFESSRISAPTNLSLKIANETIKCLNFSPLFIDIKKNHYEIRITSKFALNTICNMIESPVAPVFQFEQDGILESATYKESDWKKDQKKLKDIYQIYSHSR